MNEDLLTIAREVLVERPAKFIRRMRQGIPAEGLYALFFSQLTVEKVTVMYVKLRPTAAAVAACIIAENEAMMKAEDLLVSRRPPGSSYVPLHSPSDGARGAG